MEETEHSQTDMVREKENSRRRAEQCLVLLLEQAINSRYSQYRNTISGKVTGLVESLGDRASRGLADRLFGLLWPVGDVASSPETGLPLDMVAALLDLCARTDGWFPPPETWGTEDPISTTLAVSTPSFPPLMPPDLREELCSHPSSAVRSLIGTNPGFSRQDRVLALTNPTRLWFRDVVWGLSKGVKPTTRFIDYETRWSRPVHAVTLLGDLTAEETVSLLTSAVPGVGEKMWAKFTYEHQNKLGSPSKFYGMLPDLATRFLDANLCWYSRGSTVRVSRQSVTQMNTDRAGWLRSWVANDELLASDGYAFPPGVITVPGSVTRSGLERSVSRLVAVASHQNATQVARVRKIVSSYSLWDWNKVPFGSEQRERLGDRVIAELAKTAKFGRLREWLDEHNPDWDVRYLCDVVFSDPATLRLARSGKSWDYLLRTRGDRAEFFARMKGRVPLSDLEANGFVLELADYLSRVRPDRDAVSLLQAAYSNPGLTVTDLLVTV